MVLTGSCSWPGSWSWTHGAHLHLQAREDPTPTAGWFRPLPFAGQSCLRRGVLENLTAAKSELRREAESRRRALHARDPGAGIAIARHFRSVPIAAAAIVAAYVPTRSEADPLIL